VTDCNFNIVRCPCNGPVREVSLTLHTDIRLRMFLNRCMVFTSDAPSQ